MPRLGGLRIEVPLHRVRAGPGGPALESSHGPQVSESSGAVLCDEHTRKRTGRRARTSSLEAEFDGPGPTANGADAGDQAIGVGLTARVDDLRELDRRGAGDQIG